MAAGGASALDGGVVAIALVVALLLLALLAFLVPFFVIGMKRSIREIQRDLARIAAALDHLATRLRDDETRSHTMSAGELESRRRAALARLGEGGRTRQEQDATAESPPPE